MKSLQSDGVRVFPYINGRIFDVSTQKWSEDHAISAAAKNVGPRYGESSKLSPYRESYGSGASFVVMCPHTTYWAAVLQDTCETLKHDYDIDGVYIDQVTGVIFIITIVIIIIIIVMFSLSSR